MHKGEKQKPELKGMLRHFHHEWKPEGTERFFTLYFSKEYTRNKQNVKLI